jgi:hypothetical protein
LDQQSIVIEGQPARFGICDVDGNLLHNPEEICPILRAEHDAIAPVLTEPFVELDTIMNAESGTTKAQLAENTAKEFNTRFAAILPWLMGVVIAIQAVETSIDYIYDSLNYD